MTIKTIYPSSRPSLDLNFALSKRLDPRITFTRSSTASYFDSSGTLQSAAINQARFDHDPATKESLGLLVEEARTNSFTYSEEFDNAAWTKTNCSITANSTTAPNGLQVADTLTSSAAGTAVVLRSLTQNPSIFSVYLKANTSTVACVRILSNVSGRNVAYNVNLSAGTISAATGNTGNLTGWTEYTGIQNIGNGWYRVFIGFTSSTTIVTSDYEISPSLNRTAAASGESIFIWGAQAESGAFPTSYIATTTATVARSADVVSITGNNFSSWYNGNQGSFVATCDYKRNSGYNMIMEGVGGGTFRDFSLGVSAGNPNFTTRYSYTSIDVYPTGGPISNDTFFKIGGVYSSTGTAASFNGGAVQTTGAAAAVATPADAMTLGYRTGGSLYLNGHLSRITYWPLRLSDAQLQSLTL